MTLIAFFDGGCPLCRREIAHYRGLDRAGRIDFVDIHAGATTLATVGLDPDAAMRRMHVWDPDAGLISGVPAFVAIWRRLPGYRLLARLVTALRLTGPLEWGYVRFAAWRLARRCTAGTCTIR